jgi:hypothetical protein
LGGKKSAGKLMEPKSPRYGIRLLMGTWALCLAADAGAQENLDRGKSAAQLFASDCVLCHKSPQGLVKSGGFGLENFLREHYTASRESASAIAGYLRSVASAPAGPGRASKRAAKGDERTQTEKKAGGKPSGPQGSEKPDAAGDPKSIGPKSSEPTPAQIMAPEPKSVESRPSAPAARESKPAIEGAKPE